MSPEEIALERVVAFSMRERKDGVMASAAERIALLLGDLGVVTATGPRLITVESPTPALAEAAQATMRLAAGSLPIPDSLTIRLTKRKTLVLIAREGAWYRWVVRLTLIGHLLRNRAHVRNMLRMQLSHLSEQKEQLEQAQREQRFSSSIRDLLQEADYQFRHTADVPAVHACLVAFLRRLFPGSDGASIWSLDDAGVTMRLEQSAGVQFSFLQPGTAHPAFQGATGKALRERHPYFVVDLMRDPYILPYMQVPSRSGLAIPLFTSEVAIGAAFLSGPAQELFQEHLVWAAELLTGLAALRIQGLKSHDRQQRLLGDFALLHDLVAWRSSDAGAVDPLERIAAHLRSSAGADAFLTFRVRPDRHLETGPCDGLGPEIQALLQKNLDQYQPETLLQALTTVREFALSDLLRWAGLTPEVAALQPTGLVTVPLTKGDGAPVALVMLVYVSPSVFRSNPDLRSLLETYARYAGVVIHNLELYATVVEQSGLLRKLLERMVEAQESERRRIAADLHDWVVQGIAAPMFQIQLADRLLDDGAATVRTELKGALQQLNTASDELRRIMKGLRPYLLDELGLYKAAVVLADDWSRSHHIPCSVTEEPAAKLPKGSPAALAAFRIIQEALNNVAKHADASSVSIAITRSGDMVQIQVRDNGRGLVASADAFRGHFGLLGMQERATSVGGSVRITQPPEGGCAVICSLPYNT